MPTKRQLSKIRESQIEYPSTRHKDDPMYREPTPSNPQPMSKTIEERAKDATILYCGDIVSLVDRILRDKGCSNKDVLEGVEAAVKDLSSNYSIYIAGATEAEGWTSVEDGLPEVDNKDEWKKKAKVSKDVWTYGEFGIRIGRYIHLGGFWQADGVSSSNGVIVSHWLDTIPSPPVNDNRQLK